MTHPTDNDFLAAIARDGSADAAFAALQDMAVAGAGVKLFTVTLRDPETDGISRLYTSHPEAYPTFGTKPSHGDNVWTRTVIGAKQPFVANDIATIATVFSDHELIDSLGCQSVVNVPIVLGDEVLATINLLHEEGFYTPERVEAATELRLAGLAAVLLHLNEQDKEAA